jgi:hypothetical protein
MKQVINYFFNILISLDQLGNTLLGGDPDETISSRCAKNQDKWYWYSLGQVLEFIDPGHLEWAIEYDEGKKTNPPNKKDLK